MALQIVSPKEGEVVFAGSKVTLIIKPAVGEEWEYVLYGLDTLSYEPLTQDYRATLTIPANLSGYQELSVTALDKYGKETEIKRNILVKLPLNVVLQGIRVGEDIMVLYIAPPDSTPEDKQRIESDEISVAGLYSDGVNRSITPSTMGTTYASSDEKIATVDSEGKLTARGLGRVKITVRNGKYSAEVKVVVKPYK